jgi:antibiotic biosynthesis monooxygenase (ABM) superfamily enzyme
METRFEAEQPVTVAISQLVRTGKKQATALMTYVVMPQVTQAFSKWLYPH